MKELSAAFVDTFGKNHSLLARAPGRVNMLGEHVDYNEGLVLPAAIDRSVHLAFTLVEEPLVTLRALDLGKRDSFRLDDLEKKVNREGRPLPNWAIYPAGVAWALREAGIPVSGMQAVYSSDVPIGSGLSSSAAVEVAFAAAWTSGANHKIDSMALAQLCQRAENGYVGVASGLMDQFASVHGVAGHALYFDTRSLEWEPVPLPHGTSLVVADSGIRRSLAHSAYNERREACEEAVRLLRAYLPNIHSLRDVSPTELAAYSEFLPPVISKRAEHVVKEIARVKSAVGALKRDDRRAFGALMFAGHASLRDLYEVSLPELDTLVQIARNLPGCLGARLTGAGFGGCTINLVEDSHAASFVEGLKEGYNLKTGREAQVYLTRASEGVSVI